MDKSAKEATLALLGGEGLMPHLVIESARQRGEKVFLLAIRGVTSHSLAAEADQVVWLYLTQLGKAVRACRNRHVDRLIMAGRVQHRSIFALSLLRMDWTTLKTWWRLPDKRADTLLAAVAGVFESGGVRVLRSDEYLQPFMVETGTVKQPPKASMEDIEFGMQAARELGRLDIGQTVVMKGRAVVAVEAMEGTDECLERAGRIAGAGCVAVKMAKPRQDMRFDVPVVGLNTIEKLHKIGALGIVLEKGKTLLLGAEVKEAADRLGLFIYLISP